jgi:hypothetical protein
LDRSRADAPRFCGPGHGGLVEATRLILRFDL